VKNLDEMFRQLQITHLHATLFASCLSLPIISRDADSTDYGQSSITPEIALNLVVVFNDGHGYLGQIGEWQLNSLYHVLYLMDCSPLSMNHNFIVVLVKEHPYS
jgi:hypothetical protein